MYHFVTDKDYLKRVKSICCDIINQLVQTINNENILYVKSHLVGSGAKNLITQNASEPVDLDFNLEIIKFYSYRINDCRNIKEYIRKKFNAVLASNGWSDCHDSTSALTTEQRVFYSGNRTPFSIDLCIVKCNNDKWFRLIHQKTGWTLYDSFIWNEAPNSQQLLQKATVLKNNGYWPELRETYLTKKNMYLRRNNNTHPSFNVYIEAVNEIYYKYF